MDPAPAVPDATQQLIADSFTETTARGHDSARHDHRRPDCASDAGTDAARNVVDIKGIGKPTRFKGNEEKFRLFAHKLTRFMSAV